MRKIFFIVGSLELGGTETNSNYVRKFKKKI
jgi:hypothetical protein